MVEVLESRVLLSATEVIRNGGFEGTVSAADWVRTGAFQADSRFLSVHQGAGYAYFATVDGNSGNSLTGTMYQQATIPATASSLTFSFWTRITTSETTTTAQNDVMSVRILDASGTNVLHSVTTLSNLSASGSYLQRTFFLPRSLAGQTVRIQFDATTNGSLPTTFRVDTVSLNAVSPATSNRVVGYLPSYRQSSFSRVDLKALTHINYFSVSANTSGVLSTGSVTATNLNTVVSAAHAAGVTVSITVGPQSFSTLAGSASARQAFATNIVNYALQYNLDGIDIDWEPPAGNAVANYTLLINDLYAAASPHKLLITAAVNPWTNEIAASTVNSKMDWLNVMCYDFRYNDNANWADSISGLTDWTNWGVQKNKIVMGLPFYGRAGTSWSDTVSKTYAAFVSEYEAIHGAKPGPDVNSFVAADGKTYYMNGATLIGDKVAYVRDNGYGGMMIWELGQDYWNGTQYDQHSLLPVIGSMMKPPAWVTATSTGARFTVVAGTLYVQEGTVTLGSDAAATHPGLNVNVSSGASLVVNATQRLGGLTIANNATVTVNGGTLAVTSLTTTGTARLDLKNNRMVINYTGASPAASVVVPKLLSGRNGGAWNGSGIVSSTAAADAAKVTAIGWGEAAEHGVTTFGGVDVDATSLLLTYGYYGDTDLGGVVDQDDLTRMDRGFAKGTATWLGGDFDYDGVLTTADRQLGTKVFAVAAPVVAEPVAAPLVVVVDEPVPVKDIVVAGPKRGKVGRTMTFEMSTPVSGRYRIDWDGDGSTDRVIKAKAGEVVRVRHAFTKKRVYRPVVSAMAKDAGLATQRFVVRVV